MTLSPWFAAFPNRKSGVPLAGNALIACGDRQRRVGAPFAPRSVVERQVAAARSAPTRTAAAPRSCRSRRVVTTGRSAVIPASANRAAIRGGAQRAVGAQQPAHGRLRLPGMWPPRRRHAVGVPVPHPARHVRLGLPGPPRPRNGRIFFFRDGELQFLKPARVPPTPPATGTPAGSPFALQFGGPGQGQFGGLPRRPGEEGGGARLGPRPQTAVRGRARPGANRAAQRRVEGGRLRGRGEPLVLAGLPRGTPGRGRAARRDNVPGGCRGADPAAGGGEAGLRCSCLCLE